MRIPFPLELNVGTDIVHCRRILDWTAPNRFKGEFLLKHVLHQRDFSQLNKRFPWWQDIQAKPEKSLHDLSFWLSGRWAAKEAAKKAWGADLLSFTDLIVENSAETNSPQIICCANSKNAVSVKEQVARLSISHDGEYAVATVIATLLHPDIKVDLERRKAEAEQKVKRAPETPK